MFKKLLCLIGKHDDTGWWQPAVGGRNVLKCKRCGKIIKETKVTKVRR